jgi:hypothetical protein
MKEWLSNRFDLTLPDAVLASSVVILLGIVALTVRALTWQ